MSYNKINYSICLVCIPTFNIFTFLVLIPRINCAVPSLKGLLKREGGGGITYFHTNPFQSDLSASVWCVFFFIWHHFYQYYNICVSQKETSLIASNQQIHDFYKIINLEFFFEFLKIIVESKFLISVNYSFNITKIAAMST